MSGQESSALVRLNKVLAEAGVCSRRRADALILSGAVTVNAKPVTELGLRVNPHTDVIAVDGKPLATPSGDKQRHCYIMLHKPIRVVSTVKDPQGRGTVLDCLPEELRKKRVYPVGRLDFFSEGLLLLTDDGDLTNRLTHPRYHLPKLYEVTVREKPSEQALQDMRQGMTLSDGVRLAPVEVALAPARQHKGHVLLMTLHQGINRQIRRMCKDARLTILTLRRIQVGPLTLGDLPCGHSRRLSSREVAALKKAVGMQ